MLRKRILAAVTTLALALGMSVGGAGTAFANGVSDGPTPYTVDTSGITLPDGATFPDGGHVNIKTSAGDKGLHFESLNWPADHPKKKYIGESFLPWSAFGLEGSFCVTWVQVSMYNEHFGEGGQQAVCVGQPEEPPVTGNKVWVCKYVGTPGVNERLKAGKQPIDVSVNSIKNWDGKTFPGWFADAQGRSVAIAFSDIGGPVPTAADCPTGDEPP